MPEIQRPRSYHWQQVPDGTVQVYTAEDFTQFADRAETEIAELRRQVVKLEIHCATTFVPWPQGEINEKAVAEKDDQESCPSRPKNVETSKSKSAYDYKSVESIKSEVTEVEIKNLRQQLAARCGCQFVEGRPLVECGYHQRLRQFAEEVIVWTGESLHGHTLGCLCGQQECERRRKALK